MMKAAGLPHLADRIEVELAARVQVKSMMAYQRAWYPGDICLIRMLKSTHSAAEDEGWSELCSRVQISPIFPVTTGDFIKTDDTQYVIRELAMLVAQRIERYLRQDQTASSI
jgi:hypothetical protein